MPFYRKRPVEVEAVQWHGESNCLEVFKFLGMEHADDEMDHSVIYIDTLEGVMEVHPGDWVIRGVQGEYYPCKSEIFAATYDETR